MRKLLLAPVLLASALLVALAGPGVVQGPSKFDVAPVIRCVAGVKRLDFGAQLSRPGPGRLASKVDNTLYIPSQPFGATVYVTGGYSVQGVDGVHLWKLRVQWGPSPSPSADVYTWRVDVDFGPPCP